MWPQIHALFQSASFTPLIFNYAVTNVKATSEGVERQGWGWCLTWCKNQYHFSAIQLWDFIPLWTLRGCHFTVSHPSTNSGQGQSLGHISVSTLHLCICSNYKGRKCNLVVMLVSMTLTLSMQYLVMYFKYHMREIKAGLFCVLP